MVKDIEGPRPYLCYPFGVAQTLNEHHGIHSLTQLIEERSESFHGAVIGMPSKNEAEEWVCEQYTYKDILHGVNALCHHYISTGILPQRIKEDGLKQMVMALVAPSNVDMLMTMLAAQRLGLAVLLITPKQSHRVIKHLCSELAALRVISPLEIDGMDTTPLPDSSIWRSAIKHPGPAYQRVLTPAEEGETYGVIYHTSGTTSGLPKPLPTKHRFLVSFCAHKQTTLATLTTTPLNTGGTADVCRSMCANAPLFLFPDSLPLTTKNVCDARDSSSEALGWEVRALSCVPYVAKMLAENEASLQMLQRLEFLGVGGAPLPKATGDFIVNAGVPLVSRMGSSECNFLMCSYRDYENDKDWDYLRSEPGGHHFKFLPQNDGSENCELEVSGSWPALAVVPNHDGNFRTGDLFQPHPTTPHAWLYLGRSDDTIVLGNGKKADPKALEGALRGLTYTQDALVFGVGKNNIGVFVIEDNSSDHPKGEALRKKIWDEVILEINRQAPAHAEVYYEMIRILPSSAKFEKTAKGTIFRNGTYAKLQKEIDESYIQKHEIVKISDDDLESYISNLVQNISQKKLALDDDLFSAGINSLHSVRIRNKMVGQLGIDLPTNLVFEEPTIQKITTFVKNIRSGVAEVAKDPLKQMRDLVAKYSRTNDLQVHRTPRPRSREDVLLLTGVTGGLGSHLLHSVVSGDYPTIKKVICLVRSQNSTDPITRVQETLRYRHLTLDPSSAVEVEYLTASLTQADLGLPSKTVASLKRQVTMIIHAAWPVNFNASIASFEASIGTVSTLLEFSLLTTHASRFYFCSSTASVINAPNHPILEHLSHDPSDASGIGYSQSKWVSEAVVASYATILDVGVIRIGQLCGDSLFGVWSTSEAIPLMFATVNVIHAMPELPDDEGIAWIPVDVAAKTILDLTTTTTTAPIAGDVGGGEGENKGEGGRSGDAEVKVWHIVNPKTATKWSDILRFFSTAGHHFDILPPSTWVTLLSASSDPGDGSNPSRKLLPLWRASYPENASVEKGEKEGRERRMRGVGEEEFSTAVARRESRALRECGKVDGTLMGKVFGFWREVGLLK